MLRLGKVLTVMIFLLGLNVSAAPLTVKLEGIDEQKGKIFWAIHGKKDFLKEGVKPIQGGTAEVTELPFSFTIESVPAGEYALVLFQDLDGNEKLNTAIFSYPLEPFGFSKNPTIYFGPPSFDKAAFKMPDDQLELEIKMK